MSAVRGVKAETATGGSCGRDWSVAKNYELFLVDEDDLETATKKVKEHHQRRKLTQARWIEEEQMTCEIAEQAQRG